MVFTFITLNNDAIHGNLIKNVNDLTQDKSHLDLPFRLWTALWLDELDDEK